MTLLFRAHDLEAVVAEDGAELTPPTEAETKSLKLWRKDDAKAAIMIGMALEKTIAELILTCSRARELWGKLCARYERSSSQRLNVLRESFLQARKKADFLL